jgi:hypothetical protein
MWHSCYLLISEGKNQNSKKKAEAIIKVKAMEGKTLLGGWSFINSRRKRMLQPQEFPRRSAKCFTGKFMFLSIETHTHPHPPPQDFKHKTKALVNIISLFPFRILVEKLSSDKRNNKKENSCIFSIPSQLVQKTTRPVISDQLKQSGNTTTFSLPDLLSNGAGSFALWQAVPS